MNVSPLLPPLLVRLASRIAGAALTSFLVVFIACGGDDGTSPPVDAGPVARISGPESITLNCSLSGSARYHGRESSGDIARYEWTADGRVVGEGLGVTIEFLDDDPVAIGLSIYDSQDQLLDRTERTVRPTPPDNLDRCFLAVGMIGPSGRLIRNGEGWRDGRYEVDLPGSLGSAEVSMSVETPEGVEVEATPSEDGRVLDVRFFEPGEYVVRAAVTSPDGEASVDWPVLVKTGEPLAPEGKILFSRANWTQSDGETNPFEMRFMDAETGAVSPPIHSDDQYGVEASCSEDRIVFTQGTTGNPTGLPRADLFTISHGGASIRHIVQSDGTIRQPRMRGDKVVFTDDQRYLDQEADELVMYDFSDGSTTFFYDEPPEEHTGLSVGFSPDGTVALGYSNGPAEGRSRRIYTYTGPPGERQGLLIEGDIQELYNAQDIREGLTEVAYNEDGTRVVFDLINWQTSQAVIVTADADGTNVEVLRGGRGPLGFAPNGDVIYTLRDFDGGRSFYLLSAETGTSTDLSRRPEGGDRLDDAFHGYCTR